MLALGGGLVSLLDLGAGLVSLLVLGVLGLGAGAGLACTNKENRNEKSIIHKSPLLYLHMNTYVQFTFVCGGSLLPGTRAGPLLSVVYRGALPRPLQTSS